VIRLRDVRVEPPAGSSRRTALLDGITIHISSDEYVCLCGPNGSGKSLLLKVLAGLLATTGGERTFEQTYESCLGNGFGILFQSPDDQIVGSTVARDVAFGLENRGVPTAAMRERVVDALAAAGLREAASRAPHLLSEGQKQRLSLASVLVLEPRLVLLDEPSSRLDPPAREDLRERIRRLRQSGATLVVATHRSEDVVLADRVVGLRDGRIVFDGTPAELLASPERDALGILWSEQHDLRRRLHESGCGPPAGPEWNDVDALITEFGPT
jgi:energy-coupling factor transporter ATP-binding protein EcfA2